MQGGAASLAVFLETAPPPLYLVYMLAAGFGLPVSTFAFGLYLTLCSSPQVPPVVHVAQSFLDKTVQLVCSAAKMPL